MQVSKEQQLALIARMLQNHNTLCPELFGEDGVMRGDVRQKALDIVDYCKKLVLNFYPLFELADIIVNGSVCGYTYSSSSDFDLFVVVKEKEGVVINNKPQLFQNTNSFFGRLQFKPSIYNYPTDLGMIHINDPHAHGINIYSVMYNKWNYKPIRQEYPFTVEELFREYCRYSAELHSYVADLEKINGAFLTAESCKKLNQHLFDMNNSAYYARNTSALHEYCLEYNMYRLLKRFGVTEHFYNYINDSYKYLMSVNQ